MHAGSDQEPLERSLARIGELRKGYGRYGGRSCEIPALPFASTGVPPPRHHGLRTGNGVSSPGTGGTTLPGEVNTCLMRFRWIEPLYEFGEDL